MTTNLIFLTVACLLLNTYQAHDVSRKSREQKIIQTALSDRRELADNYDSYDCMECV